MADKATPLTAYLQLVPKIDKNAMASSVSQPLEEAGSNAGTSGGAAFGAKFLAAFAAVGVGVAIKNTLTAAISSFAESEQVLGGAELLWGSAFGTVAENASNAFETVQMSQTEYLQQVNGFSTAFKESLGGDEQAAADLAQRVVQAQADVVAAIGVEQSMAQNAISGVLRNNYTMLDNLQLGIVPTQEGFAAMIAKVNEWNAANGESTDYVMGNQADMMNALVDYIEMQGLAGYASMEASTTIQGSVSGMKAAWDNFLAGLATDGADLESLTGDVVSTLTNTIGLILPRAMQVISGVFSAAPAMITSLMPQLMDFIRQLFENLPQLMEAGMQCLQALILGFADAMPELIPIITDSIALMAETLCAPENLIPIITASMALIMAIIEGVFNAIPQLADTFFTLVYETVPNTIREALPKIIEMGGQIISGLVKGIVNAGKSVADALLTQVKNAWEKCKDFLGINSPSKLFAQMGEYTMQGYAVGIDEGGAAAVKSAKNAVANVASAAAATSVTAGVTINASINASSLADVSTVEQLIARLNDEQSAKRMRVERMGLSYGY